MKKTKFLVAVAFVLIFSLIFEILVFAATPYLNNTLQTTTNFYIDEFGVADVYTSYIGNPDTTTGATITITIKKRTLLFFWSELTTYVLHSTDVMYAHTLEYQLPEPGTYKCEVEYVISGTGGADDVIPFEDTASY